MICSVTLYPCQACDMVLFLHVCSHYVCHLTPRIFYFVSFSYIHSPPLSFSLSLSFIIHHRLSSTLSPLNQYLNSKNILDDSAMSLWEPVPVPVTFILLEVCERLLCLPMVSNILGIVWAGDKSLNINVKLYWQKP